MFIVYYSQLPESLDDPTYKSIVISFSVNSNEEMNDD